MLMLGVYYFVFTNLFNLKLPSDFAMRLGAVLLEGGAALGDGAAAIEPAARAALEKEAESLGGTFNVLLLCAGLLPWLMTAEFVVRSVGIVIENGGLVKKVRFPSELLPISLLASYLFNLLVLTVIFCAITWSFTPFQSNLWWMFFPVALLHGIFILGIAYILATINVFVRDVQQLVPLVINIWFFMTPIVYIREQLVASSSMRSLTVIFDWNPMAHLVEIYRWILIFPEEIRYTLGENGEQVFITTATIWKEIGIFAAIAFGVFFVGYKTFMAQKHKFADEI